MALPRAAQSRPLPRPLPSHCYLSGAWRYYSRHIALNCPEDLLHWLHWALASSPLHCNARAPLAPSIAGPPLLPTAWAGSPTHVARSFAQSCLSPFAALLLAVLLFLVVLCLPVRLFSSFIWGHPPGHSHCVHNHCSPLPPLASLPSAHIETNATPQHPRVLAIFAARFPNPCTIPAAIRSRPNPT